MKRSKHSLSNTHLTSFDMGELVPVSLMETLPGDSIQMSTSALIRCAPMLAPPMHPVRVRLHHWFVPFRLIWDDWEDFITGGADGLAAPQFPTVAGHTNNAGTLANYLGLPVGDLPDVSALPFRAYALIFNEWYRDQDLVAKVPISTESGLDTTTNKTLLRCAWEKDYFTSARPWEQKGPAVSIPGASGTVLGIGVPTNQTTTNNNNWVDSNGVVHSGGTGWVNTNSTFIKSSGTGQASASNHPDIYVQGAGAITVNQLRESLAIQRFEEARAMYGSRYSEYLRALGVRSSDARLQRPEYLGGGVQTIQFSEVIQSAQDTVEETSSPVGTLRGHGITAMKSNRFRRFFEEHGYVITLCSILPKLIYTDGVERTWNRRSKYDFWQRELENLGQQPILKKEIYAKSSTPDATFGYQDRYEEYRRKWSKVTGEFATSMLDYWHFARSFASEPALNSTFVQAVPPERAFASTITDVIYAQFHNSVQARRLVSKFARPRTF